jgi:hypothetical protein
MDFDAEQALIASAKRERAEATAALAAAASAAIRGQWLKLRRAWLALRARIAPQR